MKPLSTGELIIIMLYTAPSECNKCLLPPLAAIVHQSSVNHQSIQSITIQSCFVFFRAGADRPYCLCCTFPQQKKERPVSRATRITYEEGGIYDLPGMPVLSGGS